MSYSSITRAARDAELQDRIAAAVNKEAQSNPQYGDTEYGQQVSLGFASYASFAYPVAVDTEAAYESALASGNEHPGGDPSVITDGAILATVQAAWPQDAATP